MVVSAFSGDRPRLIVCLAAWASSVLIGCGSDKTGTAEGAGVCEVSTDCGSGMRCLDGRCVGAPDSGASPDGATPPPDASPAGRPTDLLSARVEPADATLESIDGSMATQAFQLIGTQRDGAEVTLTGASWILDSDRVGTVDSTGTFTAHGTAGGGATLVARFGALSGEATITVNVRRTVLGTGTDATTSGHFAGAPVADPAAIEVLYPLEGAVMPANVYPPTVQWAAVGATGDFFRVRIVKPHVELTALLAHTGEDFGHGWLVPRDQWRAIADSDPDAPVVITVDRFETATSRLVGAAGPRTFRLAHGNIFGAVYYEHRNGSANILRIDTETATLTDVITTPYATSTGSRCVGCHALTRDGRYLFGTNAETESVYDLTVDLTGDPPATRYPITAGPSTASFDPTGTYFVGGNHVSGPLSISDAIAGATMMATGLPSASTAYPSWSPDGAHIVYSGDIVVAEGGHPEAGHPIGGNLYVIDRMGETLDFAAPRMVHMASSLSGAPEGGTNDAHSTWSPDSRFIAFQHGPGTFTHVVRNPGALYLLGVDGMLHRLDNANGGAMASDGYWPTFAPYITDEPGGKKYLWMAFYARRDYGNETMGTRGTGLRQLWVAAIDANPEPGTDPSFVPYWLPGQGLRTSNFSAFWAPEACRATGDACASGSECCSGRCDPDAASSFVCSPPPPAECHRLGEGCGGDSECCEGYECVANRCVGMLM